jgi:hypothetical protein
MQQMADSKSIKPRLERAQKPVTQSPQGFTVKELSQRNEVALKLLIDRLDVITAKLILAAECFAREKDVPDDLLGAVSITRDCADELTSAYCLLGSWQHGSLTWLEMEGDGYDLDEIEAAAQEVQS